MNNSEQKYSLRGDSNNAPKITLDSARSYVISKYHVGDVIASMYRVEAFYPNFVLCRSLKNRLTTTFSYVDISGGRLPSYKSS